MFALENMHHLKGLTFWYLGSCEAADAIRWGGKGVQVLFAVSTVNKYQDFFYSLPHLCIFRRLLFADGMNFLN